MCFINCLAYQFIGLHKIATIPYRIKHNLDQTMMQCTLVYFSSQRWLHCLHSNLSRQHSLRLLFKSCFYMMVMIAALTSLAKLQQTDWFYKFTWNLFVVHTFLYSFSRFLKFSSFPFSFFSKSVICFSNAFFSSFHCCLIAKQVHKEINIFNIKTQFLLTQ